MSVPGVSVSMLTHQPHMNVCKSMMTLVLWYCGCMLMYRTMDVVLERGKWGGGGKAISLLHVLMHWSTQVAVEVNPSNAL